MVSIQAWGVSSEHEITLVDVAEQRICGKIAAHFILTQETLRPITTFIAKHIAAVETCRTSDGANNRRTLKAESYNALAQGYARGVDQVHSVLISSERTLRRRQRRCR
jgi:hypothetical protein